MSKSTSLFKGFATVGTAALVAVVFAVGTARAQKVPASLRRPTPIFSPLAGNGNGTTITGLAAMPSVISFNATNPGAEIQGSSPATVTFTINSNTKGNTWSLSVGTTATTFSGCTTVPTSAVMLQCSSATVSGSNAKGATAACSATSYTQLPTTIPGLQVASGGEVQSQGINYSVQLNYQLADSWKYIPNTCPLSITYTVNAP